jgi:hypothetical protein
MVTTTNSLNYQGADLVELCNNYKSSVSERLHHELCVDPVDNDVCTLRYEW